jgi:hypothetical protein
LQAALLSKMTAQGAVTKTGLTMASVQSNFKQMMSMGSGSSSASQAAGDAYMLYCQPLNITVPEDLAADGPLHLKGIVDPDFGAYDISKTNTPVISHVGTERHLRRVRRLSNRQVEATLARPDTKCSTQCGQARRSQRLFVARATTEWMRRRLWSTTATARCA